MIYIKFSINYTFTTENKQIKVFPSVFRKDFSYFIYIFNKL